MREFNHAEVKLYAARIAAVFPPGTSLRFAAEVLRIAAAGIEEEILELGDVDEKPADVVQFPQTRSGGVLYPTTP